MHQLVKKLQRLALLLIHDINEAFVGAFKTALAELRGGNVNTGLPSLKSGKSLGARIRINRLLKFMSLEYAHL
jgi:hypothetical protein